MKTDYPIDKPAPKKTAAEIAAEIEEYQRQGGQVKQIPTGQVTLEDDSALLRPKLRIETVRTCKGGW
jgi:hypothetical protein